jgi:hypothetical protein
MWAARKGTRAVRGCPERTGSYGVRPDLRTHALVTVLVSFVALAANFTLANDFPWSVFPIAGMGVGLWFNSSFGVDEVRSGARPAPTAHRRAR